ncbi:molybdopterin biosynthesis protein MoaB related protein [Thermoplasma acidophilum]|uniref:Molybdopterin biosynthesis protein MoaB related protein n=1 Tax=Thermoplasma acidophilum (strain ATCC 25905 / DSM 1728 / JCM 9062 / NBRC 15155 / AMRC-C165) TaxID=273075 RepID=Q9HKV0_THEAC|nr:molybdenum cofactor biosynthesis protein B [Thermoplasma acidophilum]MCY0852328.1 molybdenum cofactor biosynthesis protein MoaB [Thermoplasma acidophilum]CAC11635.1 molybdopterin biosynthesis protein MoaB related protein [Thermoplasma acidophilum]
MEERPHHGEKPGRLRIKIITVSSTRTPDTDESGRILEKHFEMHSISRTIIRDDPVQILSELFKDFTDYDAFVYNGGTGVSRYDLTSVTLRRVADKEVPGFGEIFRRRSEAQAGVFAYISSSNLFIIYGKPVFVLPGSPKAQDVGAKLILEMIDHVIYETRKE